MEAAQQFATEWVDAWNSRDLLSIMSHYSDDISFSSPRVAASRLTGSASGTLQGKAALQQYFQEALDHLKVIKLTVQDVLLGVEGTFSVIYTRETGAKVVEVFQLDQQSKATAVQVFYDNVC